ncbi:methyltransferase domain-containing protein [Rhodobacteraceae bacterium 2CG4]|uniref:Methyltransferase domain-containing protein n=1 Tax=Halovulum marinum TaxID=2662447 RepID=A0A6L5Z1L1_9RHOB|nr:cyclopropane-fatty-acyl-phospholipid synthase family protein [Halovulum marinum]MSU90447.1 methyltransferase domain-containing protein [Halovulum marinum]
MGFFTTLLDRAVKVGSVTLIGPDGSRQVFSGDIAGPAITVRLTAPGFDRKVLRDPELAIAEAYMDGRLVLDQGRLSDLFEIYHANQAAFDKKPGPVMAKLAWLLRRTMEVNAPWEARRNAARHYDLGNAFYRRWLDRDMQYSCAYFENDDATLEQAQTAKKRHIAAKLNLTPGQRVLDIGCGWGGMALYLAAVADVEVVGITLAEEQLAVAQARAEAASLSGKVRFVLRDYRDVTESFDRIVSVGMLEHVGPASLERYFQVVHDRLTPDGVALIHSISARMAPRQTSPFLRKYIFPGGSIPAISDSAAAVEKSGLWPLDTELLRIHYARTLRAWGENFEVVRDEVVDEYGERFARMWDFYLTACQYTFSHGNNLVYQMQLGRSRDAVPITRNYLEEAEARYREREAAVVERLLASTDAAFRRAGPQALGRAAE